ncbi:MAG TPA: oligosaccharide flippase family protein [Candidatus Thermoplasmatota archaeon]|nr:oligosaccharide flippase family protein [Candidatus Thermoplasmatota archaeon]
MVDPVADPAATPPRSGLGRKAGLVLGSQMLGSLMGFATLLVVGRYFEPASYGLLVFAWGALGILQLMADLGFGAAHIHFVGRGTEVPRALGVYARVRLGLTLAVAMAVGIGAYVWLGLLGKSVTDATTLPIVAAVLAAQGVTLLRTVAVDTWVGQERFNRSEATKALETFLVLASLTGVGLALAARRGRWTPTGSLGGWLADLLGMRTSWTVEQAGLALALAYLCAKLLTLLPVAGWWLKDRVRLGAWDPWLARRYAAYALPVALATAASMLVAYTDVVMLGYFKTAADVGHFAVAQKLAGVVGIVAGAVAAPLLPRFSLLLRQRKEDEAREMLRSAERFLLLVAVPAAAVLVALPGPLIHIAVGDNYASAAVPIRFLALAGLVGTAMVPTATKVMGSGRARAGMVGTLLTVGTNALLNLWLIPDWGAGLGGTGAAISALLATLVGATYIRLLLRRSFGVPAFDPLFARMGLAGAAAAGFCALALHWAPAVAFSRFWMVGLWAAAGLAVFLGAAALLRLVRLEDLRTLARLASPRELLRELRGRSD